MTTPSPTPIQLRLPPSTISHIIPHPLEEYCYSNSIFSFILPAWLNVHHHLRPAKLGGREHTIVASLVPL
ncbi:hypothetical protein IAQ61_004771 [Plenodomus lingam]|uniref:uncharacterized protein n=1 Tax=Leptosphaeria maculans TaxID=5022 RepID=UPI00332ACDC1|nr:hypothetical protein IAQ61_004771 [Plenodomus lingam]